MNRVSHSEYPYYKRYNRMALNYLKNISLENNTIRNRFNNAVSSL